MISVTLTNPDGIQRTFIGQPAQIAQAAGKANLLTAQHFRGDTATALAADTGMKRSVFARAKKGRVISGLSRTSPGGARMWLGYKQIKAKYAGPVQDEVGGASAGQYFWPGAFVAKMRSGHESVFMRKGKGRLPIVEQSVSLMQAPNIAAQLAARQQEYWIKRFGEQLNYRINVRG